MECWRDVVGYEGLYQVSDEGRVRTCEGKTTYTKRHGKRVWKQRILKFKGETYRTGYRVDLWKDGKPKTLLVARLVAFTFYSEDINNKYLTVNHIDGNRFNNNLKNLELVSLKENIQHAFRTGLMNTKRTILIDNVGNKKEFISMTEASKSLGRNDGYIYGVIKNDRIATDVFGNCYDVMINEKPKHWNDYLKKEIK